MAKKLGLFKQNVSSGAVLLIVLLIILIFIITASFLLSVIFGLILAYFFLPLQLWLKNKIFSSKLANYTGRTLSAILFPITYPLKKLTFLLPKTKRLDPEPKIIPEQQKELKLIKISCRATVFLIIFFLLAFMFIAALFSTKYFAYATKSLSTWAQKTTLTYEKQKVTNKQTTANNKQTIPKDFFKALIFKLDSLKPKLEKYPLFKTVKSNVTTFLKDPDNLKKLFLFGLSKSGGIISYTAGLLGTIVVLLLNLVFTFFFFAFFLGHMARFNNTMHEKATTGKHIVNGLINTGWLPKINKSTKHGTISLLDGIFARLHSWVRGYLTIIIIETLYYVTTFLLVGVPYGIILGILAGLTILLPYIGPAISILLTVTVCLFVGTGSILKIIIVILLYLIMNGIIEQLFLYPAVVGAALGLNEFETIVFVLIGGILAGIPGLIFAVPAVSILKYLIPQVYIFLQNKKTSRE